MGGSIGCCRLGWLTLGCGCSEGMLVDPQKRAHPSEQPASPSPDQLFPQGGGGGAVAQPAGAAGGAVRAARRAHAAGAVPHAPGHHALGLLRDVRRAAQRTPLGGTAPAQVRYPQCLSCPRVPPCAGLSFPAVGFAIPPGPARAVLFQPLFHRGNVNGGGLSFLPCNAKAEFSSVSFFGVISKISDPLASRKAQPAAGKPVFCLKPSPRAGPDTRFCVPTCAHDPRVSVSRCSSQH